MNKIGFIGLGIMGKPMARNLMKAGHTLVVCDVSSEPVAELVREGAEAAASLKEVAERCDILVTMLPNSPHVKAVVMGPGGILEAPCKGKILIDMSSISPLVAKEVASAAASAGLQMLDAPVSGGEPKAINGTLAIMVGGDENVFNKVRPLLLCMGASAVHVGEIGSGNVTKLANQIIVALNIAAMSEAMVLATKSGVDPKKVYDAIRGGLAGSTVLDAKMPMVLNRDFKPGFRIELHIKDLLNALDTAHGVGVPIPLTSHVLEMMQALKVDGRASEDHSALIRFYEGMAQTEVVSGPDTPTS